MADPYNTGIYVLLSRLLVFAMPLTVIWASYIGIYFRMTHGKEKVINFIGFQTLASHHLIGSQQQWRCEDVNQRSLMSPHN